MRCKRTWLCRFLALLTAGAQPGFSSICECYDGTVGRRSPLPVLLVETQCGHPYLSCRLNARTVIFKNRDIGLTALGGRNRAPVRLSTLDEQSDWPTETVLLRKHRYISIPIRSSTELPMSRYEYSQAHASNLPEVYLCISLQDHNSGDSENQGLEILDVKGAQPIVSWISHLSLNRTFVLEALLY